MQQEDPWTSQVEDFGSGPSADIFQLFDLGQVTKPVW